MFADTAPVQLFEPNVLYLDEVPPKIVKKSRCAKPSSKTRTTKTNATKQNRKKQSKKLRKSKAKKSENISTVKKELCGASNGEDSLGYDPLYMSQVDVKMKIEPEEFALAKDDNEPLVCPETNLKSDYSTDEEFIAGLEKEMAENNESSSSDDEDDDDDEPLIVLAKRRGRPPLHPEKASDVHAPRLSVCREKCKYQCKKKFPEQQRQLIYDTYWSLTKDERVQYVRKHILAKRYSRLKRNKPLIRERSYCYYLNIAGESNSNMTRVCRVFFEATLCLTDHSIKKDLKGYQLEWEHEMKPLWQQKQEEEQQQESQVKNQATEIQQILDPETGNLITIDPKAKTSGKRGRRRRNPDEPPPKHVPKPINCHIRCTFKCHTLFTEEERKNLCDAFWSLDYKRRKDYVLARVESKEVQSLLTSEFRTSTRGPRSYQTKCYLRSGTNSENKRVCKHFFLSTLCIDRKFIENAIEFADKTTGFYTGRDRRGYNSALSKTKIMCKKDIHNHISSYCTWVPNKKSKRRYLSHKLSIKFMYDDYKDMCIEQQREFVSTYPYYKSFHEDFRLAFLRNPTSRAGKAFHHINANISHYTGEEPGGFWMNCNGEKLDTINRKYDFSKNLMRFPQALDNDSMNSSIASTTHNTNDFIGTTNSSSYPEASTGVISIASAFSLNQRINNSQFMDPSTSIILNSGAVADSNSGSGLANTPLHSNRTTNTEIFRKF